MTACAPTPVWCVLVVVLWLTVVTALSVAYARSS